MHTLRKVVTRNNAVDSSNLLTEKATNDTEERTLFLETGLHKKQMNLSKERKAVRQSNRLLEKTRPSLIKRQTVEKRKEARECSDSNNTKKTGRERLCPLPPSGRRRRKGEQGMTARSPKREKDFLSVLDFETTLGKKERLSVIRHKEIDDNPDRIYYNTIHLLPSTSTTAVATSA